MSELTDSRAAAAPRHAPRRSDTRGAHRWAWVSIPLVVLGIVVPSIQSRDGGAIGFIARSSFLSADGVALLALVALVLGIIAGWVGRRSRAARIGLWIGVGYLVISLVAGLFLGLLGG